MKSGDDRGIDIEAYYTRYGPMVLRRCRSMLRDEQAAFDALQEVFLKVLKRRDQLTGDHPSSLLFRIATNTCLNRIRDDRKHEIRESEEILHHLSFFDVPERNLSAKRLLDYILGAEKEFTRQIAVLYFVDGMTIKEVSATVKLSISGVHKHLAKVRRKIRAVGESA
jgi:RNA polymerase sigma-70 factor (ECF subfamily)